MITKKFGFNQFEPFFPNTIIGLFYSPSVKINYSILTNPEGFVFIIPIKIFIKNKQTKHIFSESNADLITTFTRHLVN